jgi:NAD(P)H dehydrogenase (quinone)
MNVLVLNGNPEKEGLSKNLCLAYCEGAQQAGHEVITMHISEMDFDPVLHEGHHTVQNLEPDLLLFQKNVLWANHIVIVYPTWWGSMPAVLKGLFDRTFLSGFAYRYHDKDPLWDKLLKGRSAHIVTTMDAPKLWYWLVYRAAGTNTLKRAILYFCGISPVKSTIIGRIKYKNKKELSREISRLRYTASKLH